MRRLVLTTPYIRIEKHETLQVLELGHVRIAGRPKVKTYLHKD